MNPSIAAMHGYVDEIIKPEATRERIYGDIMMLSNKKTLDGVRKKHGNIPL
jgi:propionyl-CoA carboxylase beta chain